MNNEKSGVSSKISASGKTKVKLEILLLCMGYNLNKLHAKIQSGRMEAICFQQKKPHKEPQNLQPY